MRVRFLMLSLLILCVAGTCLARAEDRGSATLHPDTAVSATYGTWTVTYTVGALGMAEGAALRGQLPDAIRPCGCSRSGRRSQIMSRQGLRGKV